MLGTHHLHSWKWVNIPVCCALAYDVYPAQCLTQLVCGAPRDFTSALKAGSVPFLRDRRSISIPWVMSLALSAMPVPGSPAQVGRVAAIRESPGGFQSFVHGKTTPITFHCDRAPSHSWQIT